MGLNQSAWRRKKICGVRLESSLLRPENRERRTAPLGQDTETTRERKDE